MRRDLVAPAAAVALAALAACGDRLVGSGYAGEPLAVLSGSLVPTPETDVAGPVRLALAWYPQWLAADDPSGGSASAVAIVTEDVEAQGTFPVEFRFPVYRPPPAAALAPLGEGLAGTGAFAILLAYQDLDGDRRLSPIPATGRPVDRVIASSLLGDPRAAFALVYVDSAQPEATGLRPGFNLVQAVNDASSAVVPLATRTRLSLTSGGPIYDAFVCEAGWLTFLLAGVCGLPGGGDEQGPPGFGFDGTVKLDEGRLVVALTVTSLGPANEVVTHPDANVNVNGRVISWDAARAAFVLEEDASTLVRPGASVLVSATAAGTSRGRVFTMPGEFAVAAPAEFETVSAAAPLDVRWTASTAATSYFVGYEATRAGMATTPEPGALSLRFDVPTPLPEVGPASAFVEARVDGDDGRAFVTTALVRRRAFYFGP